MTPLPVLSEDVEKCDQAKVLVRIWQNRISFQSDEEKAAAKKVPRTVLAVASSKMKELLGDAENPMYEEEYAALATKFILDHVSRQAFDVDSPELMSKDGFKLVTFSGKELIFKRNKKSGKYLVNDIEIASLMTLDDGTIVICIEDFLFKHQAKIEHAIKDMNKVGLKSKIKSCFKPNSSDD